MNDVLRVENATKSFSTSKEPIHVIKNLNFTVKKNEIFCIMGPSGSGKSTLLSLLAGLDIPTSGKIFLNNINLSTLTEDEKAKLRSTEIGFIFQDFQLLKNLNALENVALPLLLNEKQKEKDAWEKANVLLKEVGMESRTTHFPTSLSGGEAQRVAIARSFANNPQILFADEPTANLDSKNSENILSLIQKLHSLHKSTIILVTHDPKVASIANRVMRLTDGEIESITTNKNPKLVSKQIPKTKGKK